MTPARAAAAITAAIASPLGLTPEQGALGVVEMVDEKMANAARVHAVERGSALRGHLMIAFGGAAPLHAARVAEKLGVERILVPADAGVGSAVGFLRAPVAYETIRSRYMRLDALDLAAANALLSAMVEETTALAAGAEGQLIERRGAFMRYYGQGHEISVDLPTRPLRADDVDALRTAFETRYRQLFERHIPGAWIEILSWSVSVGAAPPFSEAPPPTQETTPPVAKASRRIFDAERRDWLTSPVYERADLAPGAWLSGPALIVEDATSTYVTDRFVARVDGHGALILERRETTTSASAAQETTR